MEKIWLKHYPKNVPHEIYVDDDETIVTLFESSCQKYKKNIAYQNMGSQIDYHKLDKLSQSFAAYLQSLNLQKGSRVAIMMPNLLQYPVALFAALRAGFIVVNTNPLYTRDEVVHQLNDASVETIIVLANFAQTVEKALPDIPSLKNIIITEIGDLFSPFKGMVVNFVVKYIKKMVPDYNLPHAVSFKEALKKGQNATFQRVSLNKNDIAFLQYTGGTTGVAKAAVLTHNNMVANVKQASTWLIPLSLDDQEIIITALPLYHIFSLTANCLTFLQMGAKNVLITNPRDVKRFIKEIKDEGFTAITGVNTLFNALLNHPDFDKIDFSKLKLALAGGMALQQRVSMAWHERTNAPVLEAYGLTETSPAATINPMYLEDYNGSIGLPLPSTEVSIRDDSGTERSIGEEGELCIKGPQVMKEYWNRPDETKLVFWDDQFLRTGDIAKMDEKGFVYLVDRKKDMIVVSGFNVYPNEVEQVINMMPGVLEVGVIGVTDNSSGEKVKACVVRKDNSLTREEIVAHCREHLTAYKVPKIIEFYDELPKTNVGKILRRALR